jgi:hypothetical protein
LAQSGRSAEGAAIPVSTSLSSLRLREGELHVSMA